MGYCVAPNCKSHSSKGNRLFRFPKEKSRRAKWMQNCRRDKWQPTEHSQLCEVHFEESQFESHRADGLRKLKPNAVPTIFNNEAPLRKSSRKQKKDLNCKKRTSRASDKEEAKTNVDEQENINPPKKEAKSENTEKDCANSPHEISEHSDVLKTSVRGRKRGRPPGKCRKDDDIGENPDKFKGRKRGRPSATKRKNDVCLSSPTRKSLRCQKLISETNKKKAGVEEASAPVDKPVESSSGAEIHCFVCHKLVNKGVSLHTMTNTTKVYMHQKLDKIVTGEMELIIEDQGILCIRCANLLNYIDRIEVELNMLTKAILNSIRRNYGMGIKTTDKGQQDLLPDTEELNQEPLGECLNIDLQSETGKYLSKQEMDSEENTIVSESSLQKVTVADKETHSEVETAPLEEISCHLCKFKTCYKSVLLYHLRQHLKSTYWCDFCNISLPESACNWMQRDLELKLKEHNQKSDSCTSILPDTETSKAKNIPCVEVKNGTNSLATASNSAVTLQPVNNKDMSESKITVVEENPFVNELQEDTKMVKLSRQMCSDEPTSLGSNNNNSNNSSSRRKVRILNDLGMVVTQEVGTNEQTESQEISKILPEESLPSELSRQTADTTVTQLKILCASSKEMSYEGDECHSDNKGSAINEVNMIKEIGLTVPHTSGESRSKSLKIVNNVGVTEATSLDSKDQLIKDNVNSDPSLEADDTKVGVTPSTLTYSGNEERTENVADREFHGENKDKK